jgi:hypothetical protein
MTRITQSLRCGLASLILICFSILSRAQDGGVDIDVNLKKESQWYEQPWVWVIGGAVFILLLVALLRGGSRKSEA